MVESSIIVTDMTRTGSGIPAAGIPFVRGRSGCLDTVCVLTYALERGSGCRSHLLVVSRSVPKAHRLALWSPTCPAVRCTRAGAVGAASVGEMCERGAFESGWRLRLRFGTGGRGECATREVSSAPESMGR